MGRSVPFNLVKDIPDLSGKVILVTGGNAGLGKQSILSLARHHPAQIWLAARSLSKANEALEDIKREVPDAPINVLELDLASFESVQKAAAKFTAESSRLDILMLNAGIMASPPGLTKDGYELQFGTNHMGHALLTKLLVPILDKTAKESADVRIISLSSALHSSAPKEGIRFDSLKTTGESMSAFERYGQSKLANVLFAREVAKQYPQFTVAAIHPGLVQTNLLQSANGLPLPVRGLMNFARRLVFTSVEDGAKNQLWASVSKDVKSGHYYVPVGVDTLPRAQGTDDAVSKKLWDWTEKELESFMT